MKSYSARPVSQVAFDLKSICFICMFLCVPYVMAENRRPVYNIAHMVNSIKDLDDYLDRGANGIEMDITFFKNGTVNHVYHGYPCDCYRICDERVNLDKYLNYIRDLADKNSRKYRNQLTMLLFDLKLDEVPKTQKFRAGEEIAKHLISHLWNKDKSEPSMNVLISVGRTSDADVIRGIQDTFRKSNRGTFLKKLGFDVGLNDELSSIRKMWSKLGIKTHRWQGDGITNCLRPFKDDSRLREAIRYRDSSDAFVEKVYDWTVDLSANMRSSLGLGVDAILTNFPERVHSVLQEKEFRDSYRLATKNDDPFSRVSVTSVKVRPKLPSLDSYVSSARESIVALLGYVYDFYRMRLQDPATLFPMIQEMFSRSMPTIKAYTSSLRS